MLLRIHGHHLPGRRCRPAQVDEGYQNVHVGVQRRREVVELRPGDADSVDWEFEVDALIRPDGSRDVRGPFVQGRPGERFLYLSWGTVDAAGAFTMFRRAKLMFDGVDDATLASAAAPGGALVATLGLTLPNGTPLCAAVRPPMITWSAAIAQP